MSIPHQSIINVRIEYSVHEKYPDGSLKARAVKSGKRPSILLTVSGDSLEEAEKNLNELVERITNGLKSKR